MTPAFSDIVLYHFQTAETAQRYSLLSTQIKALTTALQSDYASEQLWGDAVDTVGPSSSAPPQPHATEEV